MMMAGWGDSPLGPSSQEIGQSGGRVETLLIVRWRDTQESGRKQTSCRVSIGFVGKLQILKEQRLLKVCSLWHSYAVNCIDCN